MSTKVRIVKVERDGSIDDIGALAAKAMPPGRRFRYRQKLIYMLDDGRTLDATATGLTKPRLNENIAATTRYAEKGCLAACFSEETGEFWGTSTTVSLSLRE